MQKCTRCDLEKDESEFNGRSDNPRIDMCKKCRKADGRRVYRQKKRNENAKIVQGIREESGCVRCGIKDGRVLQFHHPYKNSGDGAVQKMVWRDKSIASIMNEIKSCVVLCSNCHIITHKEEAGSKDTRLWKPTVEASAV